MKIIEKYINSISITQDGTYRFYEDGCGDFEESATDTTIECLDNYINYCNDQIKFAIECIDKKYKS